MRSELSKRISKLENRGFPSSEIRLAYLNFSEHGITPKDPRLARIVANLHQCLEEIEANAEGLDHDHSTAP